MRSYSQSRWKLRVVDFKPHDHKRKPKSGSPPGEELLQGSRPESVSSLLPVDDAKLTRFLGSGNGVISTKVVVEECGRPEVSGSRLRVPTPAEHCVPNLDQILAVHEVCEHILISGK